MVRDKCFFCVLEYRKDNWTYQWTRVQDASTSFRGTPLCIEHVEKWEEIAGPYMINEGQ